MYQRGRDSNLICNVMLKIFFNFLTDRFDAFNKSRLVIGGDFNTTLDPALDANRPNKLHAAKRARLTDFMRIVKLSDVFREKNPRSRKCTYHHDNGTESRLDYVFMPKKDLDCVKNCNICSDIDLSDHFPMELTLKINTTDTNDNTFNSIEKSDWKSTSIVYMKLC